MVASTRKCSIGNAEQLNRWFYCLLWSKRQYHHPYACANCSGTTLLGNESYLSVEKDAKPKTIVEAHFWIIIQCVTTHFVATALLDNTYIKVRQWVFQAVCEDLMDPPPLQGGINEYIFWWLTCAYLPSRINLVCSAEKYITIHICQSQNKTLYCNPKELHNLSKIPC